MEVMRAFSYKSVKFVFKNRSDKSPSIKDSAYMEDKIEIKDEVLRYLGHRGQKLDGITEKMIDETIEEIGDLLRERSIYKEYNLRKSKGGLFLEGTNLYLPGEDIKRHLSRSKTCFLMAVTLGHEVDRKIRYYEKVNMTKALILDATATAFIEKLSYEIYNKIESNLIEDNKKITERYSPGYGDLPIELQNEFLRTLDSQRMIGLTTTSTSILIPRKSVTAIVGVIDYDGIKLKKNCRDCNSFKTCNFSREDKTCDY